jgi:histidyl-tRNA synthetase
MNKIVPKTLKGFRDFLPKEARKRQYVVETLRRVFESYGFEPLETPALEYAEILEGKYGEEGEKLMYKFEDKGGRKVAMRYDQTVPLARVVAQYANVLPLPFKRYQIQNVWRGENPQAGRFREFLQCDIDTIGSPSLLADAEIIEVAAECLRTLGFKKYKILINDRKIFPQLNPEGFVTDAKLSQAIRSLDKIKKIGEEGVTSDLISNGFSEEEAKAVVQNAKKMKSTEGTIQLFDLLGKFGVKADNLIAAPELARGLDYYTGTIFEIEIDGYDTGSVCGGGRYDNLIGMYAGLDIPAVGCAFGFDRIIEAMDTLDLFPKDLTVTKVLVTVFSPELIDKSIEACDALEKENISQELYVDENAKMEKQLKYADQKGIPYVIIIGPKEAEENAATVKNLKTGEQKTVKLEQLPEEIK